MQNQDVKLGRIVTFYSFKGGVGRTMALANIAFLAALNGHRVLVMDWDLEAPGLAYYFRGLLDAADAKSIKEAPGVLNILWDWSTAIQKCSKKLELEALSQRYKSGQPFQNCVRQLADADYFPEGAALDFIGAGSRVIEAPMAKSYEEALAHFSWSAFFEKEAGGAALESLRSWAKNSYDFIFMDSRTGLADVAGICTMQIPDVVALCFILNRQNIDGVAKVAAAIRAKRSDQVPLRAMPMRIARQNTSEESDARARAMSELTRIGGFSLDAVQDDFRALSIAAAENVPFYETLAPFAAPDPTLDLLTINYLRTATQLLEIPLEARDIHPEMLERARRRLQPAMATVEYVTKLASGEPARAIVELQRLIENAFEIEIDGGGLQDDYVQALVEATFSLITAHRSHIEIVTIQAQLLSLLRLLVAEFPQKWDIVLMTSIERYLTSFGPFLDTEEEQVLLEELDGFLSQHVTTVNKLKRISNRRRVAKLFLYDENVEGALQTIGEMLALANVLSRDKTLSLDQYEEILVAEIDAKLIRGDALLVRQDLHAAYEEFDGGLYRASQAGAASFKPEICRIKFDLHSRLAQAPPQIFPISVAAEHAVQAYKSIAHLPLGIGVLRFQKLASVVLQENNQSRILEYYEAVIDGPERNSKVQLANYFGRQTRSISEFFTTALHTAQSLSQNQDERISKVLTWIIEICELILKILDRRRHTIGDKAGLELAEAISSVLSSVHMRNMQLQEQDWQDAINALVKSRRGSSTIPSRS